MESTETRAAETFHNSVVDDLNTDSIEMADWQPVSPRYPTALRIHIGIYAVVFFLLPWVLSFILPYFPRPLALVADSVAAIVFLFLLLVWVPRRARHTRYLLRELDINLQKGCWWHQSTSVAINRIQHLEVSQGPIERAMGLSKLSVFTAGGMKSDLLIPGLQIDEAQKLKTHLLEQTGNEAPEDAIL